MLKLAQIYRHPVKGLTPEPLTAVGLTPGEGLATRVWLNVSFHLARRKWGRA